MLKLHFFSVNQLNFRIEVGINKIVLKIELGSIAIFCGVTARLVLDLVGKPKDRFSLETAQIKAVFYEKFYVRSRYKSKWRSRKKQSIVTRD